MTATEANGGTSLPNSITVNGLAATTIYVSPGNTVKLTIGPQAGVAMPQMKDVHFTANGGAVPAANDFAAAVELTVGVAGATHLVQVGIDTNLNGTLDAGEPTTHSVTVRVINFAGATMTSQRTAPAAYRELAAYAIKLDEHFDTGSTFQFAMTAGAASAIGTQSMIRWQLVDPVTGSVKVNSMDVGVVSFTHALTAAQIGPTVVRFYADANNSGTYTGGEPFIQSVQFQVMDKKIHNLDVEWSTAIGPMPALAAVQAQFDAAAAILLRKDSANDWRAAVTFNVTSLTPFAPSAMRRDPTWSAADLNAHYDQPSDVVLLSQSHNWAAPGGDIWGATALGDISKVTVCWGALAPPLLNKVIAHELGHGVGLDHPGHGVTHVMSQGNVGPATPRNECTQADARAYDEGD